MQDAKYVIFKLGEDEYGLDIMDVNIIEKFITIEQVSGAPNNMKGIIRLRGEVIPVYSLRKKFGLKEKEHDEETRFVITKSSGMTMAYEVDNMQEISQLELDQIKEVPSILQSKDTSYMKSVTSMNGRLIILLDHEGLLTEQEQKQISSLINKKSSSKK